MFVMDDDVSYEIKNRRKKRAIKVALTEGLMVIAVIALVVTTTLIAIGYNVNPGKDWSVERTGLVQIQTLPTGARVSLDGNMIFGWTNLSRSMSEGEHEIVISRDGYDSWSKNILVTAGLYYRLNYPRLFLTERKTETIADFSKMELVSFAKDGNLMLAVPEKSTDWSLYKINEEKPSATKINVDGLFTGAKNGVFVGEIEVDGWSGNSNKVLMRANGEWVLLDVKKPDESVNLSQKFGAEFFEVKIANDAATELFVLENGNLRMINVNDGKISEVLLSGVKYIDNLKSDVVYVTNEDAEGHIKTGIYRNGEKGGTVVSEFLASESDPDVGVRMMIGEYFGEYYVMEVIGEEIGVYKGEKLPSFGEESTIEPIMVEKLGFVPEKLETTGGGGLFNVSAGAKRATFDIETMKLNKWDAGTEMKWLDEHMVYGVKDSKLVVADFDGENYRVLAEGVKAGTEVKISGNNRWMYFLDETGELIRMQIS